MITKITTVGIWLLVFASQLGTLASAQDANPALEPIASPADPLKQDGLKSEAIAQDDYGLAACRPCPRVYGYAEALFLERDNGSFDQPIIVQTEIGIPVATFLSTSDLDFEFDPALRVVVGRRLRNGWAIEGSYLGLFDADASAFVPPHDAGTNLTFPPVLTDPPSGLGPGSNVFRDIAEARVNYRSALHSAELNLVCCSDCSSWQDANSCDCTSKGDGGDRGLPCRTFEWLAGFRYLNLSEQLRIGASMLQDPGPGVESGVYDVRTSNNLFGTQLGTRLRRWGQRWGWEATGKAGLFGNGAQEEQYVLDYEPNEGPYPLRDLISAAGCQVAFVGELNLTGIYRLTDVWNLRAGYNLIWIAGTALAPDQLDFSGLIPAGNQLSSDGKVFLHGVSGGLEARW